MTPTNTIEDHLQAAPETARVMAHARLLLKAGRLYETAIPSGLARVSHIANIKSGIVIIHADSGAVASKIRQIAERLKDELSKRGVECSGIEVRVQLTRPPPPLTHKSERPLSDFALASLKNTMESLPENSPLRTAIGELIGCRGR